MNTVLDNTLGNNVSYWKKFTYERLAFLLETWHGLQSNKMYCQKWRVQVRYVNIVKLLT